MDGDVIVLRSLPLARTRVWTGNPRKTVRGVDELAASIRDKGVRVPVLARPVIGDPFMDFEIVAGQRRFLAADLAGLTEIPAIVRAVDDDEALELGLLENAARADVDPLEEAEAIERLVREHGRSVAQVAARLGRTPRWVERRRMLLNLTAESRAWALRLNLPLAHMEALAAVGTDTQARVVARMGHAKDPKDVPALARFAQEITWELHLLSGAPFPLDDAKLGGRGRCEGCAYRSDRQGDLFGGVPGGAHCLDRVCWDAKVEALWSRAEKDAKRRKLDVLSADTVSHGVDYGTGLYLRSDAPYVTAPPTPDAKPVAVVRGQRGHVYELFAKPEVAPVTKPEASEQDSDDDSAWEAERAKGDAERAKLRAEREAADAAKVRKLYDLALDPGTLATVARTALHSYLVDFDATPVVLLARSLGHDVARHDEEETLVGAFTDGEIPGVLLAVLALSQLESEPEERAPYELDVLARLAAPPVPTVRVWIAEAAWDALSAEAREDLEEPIGGSPVAWEGREGWITAAVPEGEVLTALRGIAGAMELAMPEGDAQPAAPVADAPARPEVELRVKRGTWLQHRSGLQDSAKGLLHKRWEAVEDQRVATLTTKDDAARGKVFDYCRRHGVPLAVDGVEVIVAKGGAR